MSRQYRMCTKSPASECCGCDNCKYEDDTYLVSQLDGFQLGRYRIRPQVILVKARLLLEIWGLQIKKWWITK